MRDTLSDPDETDAYDVPIVELTTIERVRQENADLKATLTLIGDLHGPSKWDSLRLSLARGSRGICRPAVCKGCGLISPCPTQALVDNAPGGGR